MNCTKVIRTAFPKATDAEIEHIVWGMTPYPFRKIGPKQIWFAANRFYRAVKAGIRLCDMCSNKAINGRWLCVSCDKAIKERANV